MSGKIFDINELLVRVQDDKELLIELLDIFEEFYPERRVAIDEAARKNDSEEIKDIIHSIKGAAGNISAITMHELCAELEKQAEKKDLVSVEKGLAGLDQQFDLLKSELKKTRNDFQATS